MSEQDYKLRHEEFVTGLSGGSISEIYVVTLIAFSAYVAWCALKTRFESVSGGLALADFVLNWLGLLLSTTLYAGIPWILNLCILIPALLVSLASMPRKLRKGASKKTLREEYLPKRSYLTAYRGGMMVVTCMAILAVDFPIFPRRFAKVENWGTSLMDLGVGSFVFSMGVVSARSMLVDRFEGTQTPFGKALVRSVRQAFSVLMLGLIRLLAVKYFDYHEHVTEYGVHWNFFMTLGLLPPFVTVFEFLPKNIPTIAVSLAIAVGYELLLNQTDLGAFILTAPRVDIISANKEGIFSFFGYLSIFLAGKSTGYFVLPSSVSIKALFIPQTQKEFAQSKGKGDARIKVAGFLVASSFAFNLLLFIADIFSTPSRRLANLPYVLWVCAYNTGFLALFVIAEIMFFSPETAYSEKVPESLEAVNINGLAIFLLANVSTGVINMNLHTLDMAPSQSMAVLVGYLFFLFGVCMVLYKRNIVIKI